MQYEIVLTTAEDIVSVVDAALAGKDICDIQYISEFADISEQQAQNAIKWLLIWNSCILIVLHNRIKVIHYYHICWFLHEMIYKRPQL